MSLWRIDDSTEGVCCTETYWETVKDALLIVPLILIGSLIVLCVTMHSVYKRTPRIWHFVFSAPFLPVWCLGRMTQHAAVWLERLLDRIDD